MKQAPSVHPVYTDKVRVKVVCKQLTGVHRCSHAAASDPDENALCFMGAGIHAVLQRDVRAHILDKISNSQLVWHIMEGVVMYHSVRQGLEAQSSSAGEGH